MKSNQSKRKTFRSSIVSSKKKGRFTFQNEKPFQALTDSSFNLITVVDFKGQIIYQNKAIEKILGYKPEEVLGKSVFEFIHPGDLCPTLESFSKSLNETRPIPQILEVRIGTKEGTWFLMEVKLANLLTNPDIQGIVLFASDMTQQKKLEREIMRFYQKYNSQIAHQLHDGLSQELAGVEFLVKVLYQKLKKSKSEFSRDAKAVLQHLSRSVSLSRELAREVYPIDLRAAEFQKAVEVLVKDICRKYNIAYCLTFRTSLRLNSEEQATQAYCFILEAIKRSVEQGGATRISVDIRQMDGKINLVIRDNGSFDTEMKSPGAFLKLIHHRVRNLNGILEIQKNITGGMTLDCLFENENKNQKGEFHDHSQEKLAG